MIFHDALVENANGPVRSITTGNNTINFTENGKRIDTTDAVYDENGYILSEKRTLLGQTVVREYEWENGRLKKINGSTMIYDPNGILISLIGSDGKEMIHYSDFKLDHYGNWISRKHTITKEGIIDKPKPSTQTRTIEYYE